MMALEGLYRVNQTQDKGRDDMNGWEPRCVTSDQIISITVTTCPSSLVAGDEDFGGGGRQRKGNQIKYWEEDPIEVYD